MADYLYILSFNPFGDNPNSSQVDIFVRSHRDIISWYYPFVGTYYFRSGKSVSELVPAFRQFFGNSQFTIGFLLPELVGGSVPENVWSWINKGLLPTLPGNQ